MNYGIKNILHSCLTWNKSNSGGSGQPLCQPHGESVAIVSTKYEMTTWQWN